MMTSPDRQDVILVVDDSADALSLVNDTLEQVGISVLVALEGQQALTIAQRMTPDMILLDALMPKMDGFETCRRLKLDPNLASIPVIFMTGLSDTDNIVKGLEVGGVDYLTKPIRPSELIARIRVHLNNARITSSTQQALDSTGQNLITVDGDGHLLWATPQTRQLLKESESTQSDSEQELAEHLRQWLSRSPSAAQTLRLSDDAPFSIEFVEARSDNEFLLRLRASSQTPDEKLLQTQFNLTPREADVLLWIAQGKTNREIGVILDISPRTVNKHLEQVFQKVGAENRTSAASMAIKVLAQR